MRQHTPARAGLLLFDQSLVPIFMNPVARHLRTSLTHQNHRTDISGEPSTTLPQLIRQFMHDLRLWHRWLPPFRLDQMVSRQVHYSRQTFRLQGSVHALGARSHQQLFLVTYTPTKTTTFPLYLSWNAFAHLRAREQDIVILLTQRCHAPEIAQMLGISVNTVRGYLKMLRVKARALHHDSIIEAFRPFDAPKRQDGRTRLVKRSGSKLDTG